MPAYLEMTIQTAKEKTMLRESNANSIIKVLFDDMLTFFDADNP